MQAETYDKKYNIMQDIHELMMRRRSIRKYTGKPVTADEIRCLMEAALVAPTSKNTRGWHFVVVQAEEELRQLSRCKPFGAMPIESCTCAIVVTVDGSASEAWVEDASIAAAYIQLQAEALGLGSCWVQVRERMYDDTTTAAQYIRNLLGIPPQMGVECVISLGHKNEERKPYTADKMAWDKVHTNRWGNHTMGGDKE